mmetsp:Transcript_159599/g.297582  ORF Transcript_159599/g.297582 Transcript_159599/m.297582 type:complete len:251 (-) Transcript_159599:69-821(-)
MFFYMTQLLSEALPIIMRSEAMIVMKVKTDVPVPASSGRCPNLRKVTGMPLKNGQHHCDMMLRHTSLANGVNCLRVEFAELSGGHRARRLVANLNPSHCLATRISVRQDLQRRKGLSEAPMSPHPLSRLSAAWCIPTFASWSAMEIQQHLDTALLSPVYCAVDVFQGWALIGFPSRCALHDPVTKRQPNGIQTALSKLLKICFGDVCLTVLRQICKSRLAVYSLHQLPLARCLNTILCMLRKEILRSSRL